MVFVSLQTAASEAMTRASLRLVGLQSLSRRPPMTPSARGGQRWSLLSLSPAASGGWPRSVATAPNCGTDLCQTGPAQRRKRAHDAAPAVLLRSRARVARVASFSLYGSDPLSPMPRSSLQGHLQRASRRVRNQVSALRRRHHPEASRARTRAAAERPLGEEGCGSTSRWGGS